MGEDRAGKRRVRVSPELIDADGRALAAAVRHRLDDVFAVQASIASRVAEALDVALGGAAKQQPRSVRPAASPPTTCSCAAKNCRRAGTRPTPCHCARRIGFYQRAVAEDALRRGVGAVEPVGMLIAGLSPKNRSHPQIRKEGAERAVEPRQTGRARLAMGNY